MIETGMKKKNIANTILKTSSLFVYLNPRSEQVFVPPWLKFQDVLVLQFGNNMPIPIPDMEITTDYIVGTLSFTRTPYRCEVPWESVFALVDEENRGMVWEDNVPESIKREQNSENSPFLTIRREKVTEFLAIPKQEPIYERYGKVTDVAPPTKRTKKLPDYIKVIK